MQARDTKFVALDDGRKVCLECLDSVIMDTNECQPLYLDIQEFYESLNMKVEQQVPLLLVERQALNEAMDGERHVRIRAHQIRNKQKRTTKYMFSLSSSVFCLSIIYRGIITCLRREASAYLRSKL